MTIPAGAFDDCAKLETAAMKRPDGQPATAFTDRAASLKAMRTALNSESSLLASIDAKLTELLGRPW